MMKNRMENAVSAAKQLHEHYPEISIDTLFLAAYLGPQDRQKVPVINDDIDLPGSVAELADLKGKRATATEVFRLLNWRDATPAEAKKMGMRLRLLGYSARRSNGRLYFTL
ncbi:hypothetical protein [Aquabacterium sp.]|uniref:hypothetical protein n=1 Tax=Aquabacterium sp. TaxID=1872578 RepID=UPI0025C0F437|nr:hypothetical protein [Aquabacterium sp.]